MKNAFWAYWLILLGVLIVVIMLLVQSVTSNNTEDYYLIKELTEAAMVDAVDYSYYRQYGEIKMNKEKFYESFIRRFAENASLTSTYTVSFYDVYETPPKASVEVKSKSGSFTVAGDSTQFDIVNRIDAIIEGNTVSENGTVELPNSGVNDDSTEGNSDSNLDDTVGDSGSGNADSSSGDNTQNEKPTVSQVKDKGKTENSITVETTVNSTSDTVKEYYFSIDGGNTWQKSDKNTYTYNNLSPNTSYNVQSYVKDSEGNTSNVKETKITTSDPAVNTCLLDEKNIDTVNLKGMHGVMMVNYRSNYKYNGSFYYTTEVFHDYDHNDVADKLSAGDEFTILGEKQGKFEYWAIEYDKGSGKKCGWISSTFAAINLKEYIPEMEYNITNLSGSIYKAVGHDLPNVTGKRLYSNKFANFVPALYNFAKKLKTAAANARNNGDTLVVYDAYRPSSVSKKASDALNLLITKNSGYYSADVVNKINYAGYDKSWFLAQGLSAHNTACAVDITIKGATMPSDMHELSTLAAKYATPGSTKYASRMTSDAKKLDKYMKDAKLNDLASEWWHFQDTNSYKLVRDETNLAGANFWSA